MHIDLVTPSQHESLIDLLYELHAFYNAPPTTTHPEIKAHLLDHLLARDSGLNLILATSDEGHVIGLAAVTFQLSLVEPSPALSKQCQLKELYVRAEHRNQGIGRALFKWVANYAINKGCGRMDWHAQAGNHQAVHFYQSLQGKLQTDRLSFRLSRAQLEQLAA